MAIGTRSSIPSSLALRFVVRDFRSGELILLAASLLIAVAAISAVLFFTDRVGQAVSRQAGELLAADLRLESDEPLAQGIVDLAISHELATAEIVQFNSVVLSETGSSLVDIRAITDGYPLRGKMRIANGLAAEPYETDLIPAPGTAWAEPSLLVRLGIDAGATIDIGRSALSASQTLEFRPDEGWRLMEVAPTVLINIADLEATGLLGPGSIVEYELLLAGEAAQIAAFREQLLPLLTPGIELRDARSGRPEVTSAIDRAEQFLMLSAMISVLLAGVAVAMASRQFVARRLDTVALMKCIGAKHRDILRLVLLQLLAVVVFAGVFGSLVGFLAQYGLSWIIGDLVEARLPPPSIGSVWFGPLTALVVAVGFAAPRLAALGRVPPMRVLRQDLEPSSPGVLSVYGLAILAVAGLLYLIVGDTELVAYVLLGVLATLGVLFLAGGLLVLALQRLRGRVGVSWRYGIANVARRGRESTVQIAAFGLGLMVLLLLTVLRTELMAEWQELLPAQTANQFMINIQPGEPDAIASVMAANGMAEPQFTPLLRARIAAVNQVSLEEYAANPWARRELEEEINLTWLADPGEDNRITAGEWWADTDDSPQLSLEESLAQRTGLELGDRVTFTIGGELLEVEVTSIRSVQWETFRPNFFMVINPGHAEAFAHTYISSFRIEDDDRAVMLELARQFPAVSVIDIGSVIDQVRDAMSRAAMAVQYVFLFTLAAGVMVMLSAIQSTRSERMFESAILRTLGASSRTVFTGLVAEFVVLGLLAGLVGAGAAGLLSYLIASRFFDLDYLPGAGVLVLGLLVGGGFVGLSGTLALRSVVRVPPVRVLRRA